MTVSALAGVSLQDAKAAMQALELAIMSGSLNVRYSDGTSVTYRSLAEMERISDRLRGQINAATATDLTEIAPVRAFRFTPNSGYR